MATLELPTLNDGTPSYSFRTKLDGTDYEFTFRFGERRQAWVFDLATTDGIDIIRGQLVTVGTDLLRRVSSGDKPPGMLGCLNLVLPTEAEGGVFALPGLNDLGPEGRTRMYYIEADDLAVT